MSGVDAIPSGSMGSSRERDISPPTTADNVQHDHVSTLVSLGARHRIAKT